MQIITVLEKTLRILQNNSGIIKLCGGNQNACDKYSKTFYSSIATLYTSLCPQKHLWMYDKKKIVPKGRKGENVQETFA